MVAVIFEVYPTKEGKAEYLAIAGKLREFLKDRPGFISIERFQSLGDEDKVLSLSFWENEEAVQAWRNNEPEHRKAQQRGKLELFEGYRIRVAQVVRDYTTSNSTLKRPRYPMPEFVRAAIDEEGLMQAYEARPPYQRNDYVGWITRAKQPETQARRLAQMLDELRRGDVYMNMAYRPRSRDNEYRKS